MARTSRRTREVFTVSERGGWGDDVDGDGVDDDDGTGGVDVDVGTVDKSDDVVLSTLSSHSKALSSFPL